MTTTIKPMKIDEVGPKLKGVISCEAAEVFESKWPNLLACFDAGKVYSAIAALFTIEGLPEFVREDFSIPTLCKATEQSFLTLLKRGALDPFVKLSPLPEAAQAELDRMAGITPAANPVADPREAQAAAIAECVKDYRSLDTRSFKTKWMDRQSQRAIYEKSIAKLGADDREKALQVKQTQDARRRAAESQIPRSF